MAARLGRRRVLVVGLATLGLLGAFVGGAFASHIFSDVPTGAYYHDDVSWLVARGITSGCGGGKYCPNDAVTRGQMAKFLHLLSTRSRVGHFSCDAYGFQPASSTQSFSIGTSGASSNGSMWCPVQIPDGATIQKLSVAFIDNNAADEGCTLYRQDILSSLGSYGAMASVATTGTPSATRISTSSVTSGLVDNNYYSYAIICAFGAESPTLTMLGATIEYTYQGIPAP
jgi:hypothetical protein